MLRSCARLLVVASAVAVAFALGAGPVPAATTPFFVGADEDALVWGNSQLNASIARTLGLKAVRITLETRRR